MKKKNRYLNSARLIYLGSVAALLLGGFLMEWLVKDCGFWYSLALVLLPVLPAAAVYAFENRFHLLDGLPAALIGNYCLPITLPIILICYSTVIRDSYQNLNLYWSMGYLLCCYITGTAMSRVPGIRCGVFLVQTLLFSYLSVYQDYYAGGSIAIAVLSIFLMVCMTAKGEQTLMLQPVSAVTMTCMMLSVVVPVWEKLLYSAVSQETAIVLDSFRNLLPHVRAFGPTELAFAEYEGLMFGHQLGYLLAQLGWVTAIPVALILVVMVISGFRTAANGRCAGILTIGCQLLLVLRLVSALLYMPGLYMGLCSDIPFLGGDMLQRIVDCLLCAVVLLPMPQAELENLDPQDPDFPVRERQALENLHHNRMGLTRLCRYVYDNPDALEGWLFLFDKYFDLMDENTLSVMFHNGASVLPAERFRDLFEAGMYLDGDTEEKPSDSVNEPDAKSNYHTSGVFLKRYLGFQEKLALPPFWLAVGEDALADNPCLEEVSVPNTVLRICKNAFRGCSSLTGVQLRQGLLALDEYAFCDTGLTQIQLPPGLETLGKGCFQNTALRSVEIPGTVENLPADCFADNPFLENVVLEEGVCTVGAGAFRNCNALRSISIPDSIQYIHPTAFAGCNALVQIETADGWKERSAESLLPVLFPHREKEENK